ncbi:hypothetical protein BDP27DRAFT_1546097 [Rhodocollybia butyracea]|uniref:Uncharacterized protein n=1 Tax=Rhodocollybia butyracea TaxID=206335 RepID=A0A9P5PLU0_9AGAR|nr:hypothetical protein BDP27DRAFT_1546097 [Rhodocollybia butyracea]
MTDATTTSDYLPTLTTSLDSDLYNTSDSNISTDTLTLTLNTGSDSLKLTFDSTNESLTSNDGMSNSFNELLDPENNTTISVEFVPNATSIFSSDFNSSFTTLTTAPTESRLFAPTLSDSDSLGSYQPLQFGYVDNLPSEEKWESWHRGFHIGDLLDSRINSSIFFDASQRTYRGPFNNSDRFLPPQALLHTVPSECVPHVIRGIPCLAMDAPSLLTPIMGSGTMVPASTWYRRALVLAPLFHNDRIHYILCLHDDHDLFLIRVHARYMDLHWSCWKQIQLIYGKHSLCALFSAGIDTFEQMVEGVKRQRGVDRRRWKEQPAPTSSLTFLPSIWSSLTNSGGVSAT